MTRTHRPSATVPPRAPAPPRRRKRARAPWRPDVQALEGRSLLALLGLAQLGTKPDIASGASTHLSYTQQGNNANPFHYDAVPLTLQMPDGTNDRITNQANKAAAGTRLDVRLDNSGRYASGVTGPDFSVNGHVTIGANTYDGTLVTAEANAFGFSDTITRSAAEFEVQLVVTGGLLAATGGPYKVGDTLGLLIHQPGLTITKFPATFSLTSTTGSSDTKVIPPSSMRLGQRKPDPLTNRPALNDVCPGSPSTTPPGQCDCGNETAPAPSAPTGCPVSQDNGDNSVSMSDGSSAQSATDLTVPGRGFDFTLTRIYRGNVNDDGPLGHGWELNANRRLVVITAANLADYQAVFPSAKVGDVDEIYDNRDDLYVRNLDGSYTPPAGYFSRLTLNGDGSYTERFSDGDTNTYARPDAEGVAPMTSRSDAEGDTMRYTYNIQEQLTFVYDTYGRPYQFLYDANGRLSEVDDYSGRAVRYTCDANGDLRSVTGPAVTGTPTGNNFPAGQTTRYTYSSGYADPRLNHELLTVTAPNEVANGGPPRLTYTYDTNPVSPNAGRVTSLQQGGTNASGVQAGGTITYQYQALASPGPGDTTTAATQTTVTDRNGNTTVYQYNRLNNMISVQEDANRGVRPGDPPSYTTRFTYDSEYRLTQQTLPDGNTVVYSYDSSNPSRYQQGNLLSQTVLPDAGRGGDQSSVTTTYTYEPIYNHVHSVTEPRGNDPSYVPQNGGAQSPARYTTTYTYDYQEGTNFAALGAAIGTSAATAQARLAAAGIPMGLGDVNGDGQTSGTDDELIRTQAPTVHLLPGSNQATAEGTTLQPIVTTYAYNNFGQLTRMTDPEGNVTAYTYYPARDPNGDGVIDNPSGDPTTGGYLRQRTDDAVSSPGRNTNTNPPPATVTHVYSYDSRGNMTREVDGRGIATDYVYNQLDQVVEMIQASATGLNPSAPAEPLPLTGFQYLTRFFYDANGNMVLQQVEDRGNTSNVDGNLPAGDLSPYATNPDPAGGPAYQDTGFKYDILDHRVETDQEVSNGATPESLHTRYRYDPNGNLVLTIQPEGNATSAVYDERDLTYRTTAGATSPPPLVLLGPGDPTNYDVRGGLLSTTSYCYDANGNLIELVNGDDTDLSAANNDPALGPGDRTRYIYDGFDRLTSTVDSVGNQTVYQYDPDGNVIRVSQFGPVGGPSPTSDGPASLPQPVSSMGTIQSANLVNPNLLASTEMSYDELGRQIQTSRVLFVNTTPTVRTPDVAEGGSDVGLGNLTPGQTQAIPGVAGVTILGRVSDRTEYDRDSRVRYQVQDDLSTTSTLYDGLGRVIRTADPVGNTVEAAYDADGNVIETRETDVSQRPGVASESYLTTNYFDSLNRLQTTVDNLGHTTSYRYDSRDNLVAQADADGPPGPTVTRRWFSNGVLTSNVTNGYGNVTRYYYDGLNRQVRQEQVLTATGQGDGVHVGASVYGVKDDASAPESFAPTADPAQGGGDGLIRSGFTYDRDSLTSSAIDDQGNVTVYLYDNLNRRVTETGGLTVGSALTNASILGLRVVPTPTAATVNNPAVIPSAQIDTQLAEAQARLAAVAALYPPLANRVDDHPPTTKVWGYSPADRLLIYQDENNSETFTRYDAIGRPIAVRIFRAGRSDSFAGDPVFAPAPVSTPTNHSYDDSPTFQPVDGTTKQDFQYDGLSRIVRATDNDDPTDPNDDSALTDAYDSLGRVIEEAQTVGGQPTNVISSAWRAENLRSALTYPNGRTVVYTYDPLGRLKTVADQDAGQAIAVYDYIGRREIQRSAPINGTRETYLDDSGTIDIGYDGDRRPTELRTIRSDNSLVVGFTYSYDRTDHKLTEGKLHDPNNSETYAYDSAYRLVSFQRGAGGLTPQQSQWVIDGAGNWTQVDGETRQYSSFNELIRRNNGGTTSLFYDDNGDETDDGTYAYTYDAQNRLRTVTRKSDSSLIATYAYDAVGRRVSKVVTNSGALNGTTNEALDSWQVISETDGGGVLTRQYVYGNYIDEVLVLDRNLNADATATGPGDQRLFYGRDAQHSVYALTDTTGAVVEGYLYDAYGRQTVYAAGMNGTVDFGGDDVITPGGRSAYGNTFLFTGRRLDAETGLDYFRARYYDTTLGRFLSRDPAGFGGENLYEASFVPDGMDPLGLKKWAFVDPQGADINSSQTKEIEDFTQRFVGLIMPARAMLTYEAWSTKWATANQAFVKVGVDANFKHFNSWGRLIATGWSYRSAKMTDVGVWDCNQETGAITEGAWNGPNPTNGNKMADGPLKVSARITSATVVRVSPTDNRLIVKAEANVNVGGTITEAVTATATVGGKAAGEAGELNASLALGNTYSITYSGGEHFGPFNATYVFDCKCGR